MPHMLHDILAEGSLAVGAPRAQNRLYHFLMNKVAGDPLLMRCRGMKLEFYQTHADHGFPKSIFY